MRIGYCGNFSVRHSTETHISRTLKEILGHKVIEFQENEVHTNEIEKQCIENSIDVFMYTRTWGFIGDGHSLLASLERHGIPTVSYHLDLYWGIEREKTIIGDPFWQTKYVFTPDGGSEQKFRQAGINHFYLKPAVFEPECYIGTKRNEYIADVAFVGALDHYHPEWLPYRQQLKSFLQQNYEGFRHWPGDGPAIRNEDLNDLYASVKVVIGDSLCLGFDHPYYWSDRIYETIGRGGMLIMPRIKGLEEEFVDRKTIAFFDYNNWDQLKSTIDYYLENDKDREEVRHNGQAWVKENATYTNRLIAMFNTIQDHEGWFND